MIAWDKARWRRRFHPDDLIGYGIALGFFGGGAVMLVLSVFGVRCLLGYH